MNTLANTVEVLDPITKYLGSFGETLANITILSIIIRLLLAVLCSGIIGLERAQKRHAAGFRTYILVCCGSAVTMMVNQYIAMMYGSDAGRMGAQVISGIGFLGAGTILVTSKNQIKGLTTAAGLWACACIGLAIGAGFYSLGLISSIIIIICLALLPQTERKIKNRSNYFVLYVELLSRPDLKKLIEFMRTNNLKLISVEYNPAFASTGLSVYTIEVINLKRKEKTTNDEIVKQILSLDYVNAAELIV